MKLKWSQRESEDEETKVVMRWGKDEERLVMRKSQVNYALPRYAFQVLVADYWPVRVGIRSRTKILHLFMSMLYCH